jgi:hypothetical protein
MGQRPIYQQFLNLSISSFLLFLEKLIRQGVVSDILLFVFSPPGPWREKKLRISESQGGKEG